MATFTACYDANVHYPAELRKLLMHLAVTALTCRTYLADGRIEGLPTRQLIHQVLKEAALLAPDRAAVSGGSAKVAFSAR